MCWGRFEVEMKRKVIKIKARIKDKPKKENTVDKEQLYKYALEWAEFKYSEEIRREDSIIQQSSNMQTAFSVISAALVMAAPVMVDNRGRLPLEFFLVAFSTIILSLMLSLLFATIAQKRKPQMMVNYVEKETKDVIDNPQFFATEAQRLKYRVDYYGKIEKSLHNNNKSRVKNIKTAMILFYISLGLCAMWCITAMCILIFT